MQLKSDSETVAANITTQPKQGRRATLMYSLCILLCLFVSSIFGNDSAVNYTDVNSSSGVNYKERSLCRIATDLKETL